MWVCVLKITEGKFVFAYTKVTIYTITPASQKRSEATSGELRAGYNVAFALNHLLRSDWSARRS